MQPYLFPYIGYFQMIKHVDSFVFYDDVNFIKGGWINRNRILINKKDFLITVPLKNPSQNNLIKNIEISSSNYDTWKKKTLRAIEHSYRKASYFESTYHLISTVLNHKFEKISDLAIESITTVSSHLDLKVNFITSSEKYNNKTLERSDRLIDICNQENIKTYINPISGQELYNKEYFLRQKINLNFINPLPIKYHQFKNNFIPNLSIIDILMFNSIEETHTLLKKYEII